MTRAGICGTDLELQRGYKGGFRGIPGHEFVGVVDVVGDPDREREPGSGWLGQRVTASINVGCGRCATCRRDGPEHCARRTVIGIIGRDGAFAEYLCAPVSNLHRIPDSVVDEHAVFAEPLAAALRVREQLAIRPSQRAAVIGPGRLGMLVSQVLALAGTAVTVVGRRAESLELSRTWGLGAALTGELEDHGFDLVVDATGQQAGFVEAMRLVRPRGTIVLKSTYAGTSAGPTAADLSTLVVAEVQIVGSRCGPFGPALRLLREGAIDVASLIDGEYDLADAGAAFEHAARARKILLRPGSTTAGPPASR